MTPSSLSRSNAYSSSSRAESTSGTGSVAKAPNRVGRAVTSSAQTSLVRRASSLARGSGSSAFSKIDTGRRDRDDRRRNFILVQHFKCRAQVPFRQRHTKSFGDPFSRESFDVVVWDDVMMDVDHPRHFCPRACECISHDGHSALTRRLAGGTFLRHLPDQTPVCRQARLSTLRGWAGPDIETS